MGSNGREKMDFASIASVLVEWLVLDHGAVGLHGREKEGRGQGSEVRT